MKEEFTSFQLEEYKNISNAHFETNKQIASFFRYYLLIGSSPAFILLLFDKNIDKLNSLFLGESSFYPTIIVASIFIIISIIGFFTCIYLINLLQDSTLYARAVNGSRRYFYDNSELNFEERYRVLPKNACEPKNQRTSSLPILMLTSIINSVYLSIGTYILSLKGKEIFNSNVYNTKLIIFNNYTLTHVLVVFTFGIIIHLLVYRWIKTYRDHKYLKSFNIGIDLDGVLNKHRTAFCTYLYRLTRKTLWENEITHVPVSTIPFKDINKNDEYKVFNDPDYWKSQQIFDENTADIIDEIRNGFGYNINIFSNRPWPDTKYSVNGESYSVLKKWWNIELFGRSITLPLLKLVHKTNLYKNKLRYIKIKKLTKKWLSDNLIGYTKLVIETNSLDSKVRKHFRKTKTKYKNRFFISRELHFRYFVEDIIENATKLSSTCDYVFLMEQPYNLKTIYNLPNNVIRVKNWVEIREHIRQLG